MKTIAVNYIDTTKYRVKIHIDDMAMDWTDHTDMSTVVQFRDNDFTNYGDLEDYTTEAGKLTPAVQAKLRAGKMFTISYSRYSSADGGFYRLDGGIPTGEIDSRDVNGFVTLEHVEGMTYDQRRELAIATLKEYTDYCQGNVYWIEIETVDGREIDTCSGFIGDDSVMGYVREMIPDAQPENVEIVGVHVDGQEFETYLEYEKEA